MAEPGKRLIARLIDFGILIVLTGIMYVIAIALVVSTDSFGNNNTGFGTSFDIGFIAIFAVFWVLYWLYESFMASSRGQTVGKMIMKIRIVSARGGEVSTADGMKRSSIWLLPIVNICCIGGIAFLVIEIWGIVNLFNRPDARTLMDQFADTLVVDA